MAPSRVRGFATVWPSSVAAGIIDSSSGSASVTPAPRRKVRRDKCAFVMNAISVSAAGPKGPALLLHAFLERVAVDDAQDQRREPIVVRAGAPDDRTHARHVVMVHRPAQRVCHQLLGCRRHERVRSAQDRLTQIGGTAHRRAVSELALRVDPAWTIELTPAANQVEILERKAHGIHDAVARRAGWAGAMRFQSLT